MKCSKCGNKITKKQRFCSSCGANIPIFPSEKLLPLKLILCFALILSLAANFILLYMPNSSGLEGSGFSSPEAAITAYAKAFRDGNIPKMISSFAIESYVECFDLHEYINKSGYYDFYNADVGFPNKSEYQELLNQYTRQNSIVRQIKNGYFTLTNIDNSRSIESFSRNNNETEIESFLEQLEYPNLDQKLSRIKIGAVLTTDDFSIDEELYSTFISNYSYCNAEEFYDIAIEITFDSEEYYLFMLTAKMNGKWYNITTVSPLGLLNKMDSSAGGLIRK